MWGPRASRQGVDDFQPALPSPEFGRLAVDPGPGFGNSRKVVDREYGFGALNMGALEVVQPILRHQLSSPDRIAFGRFSMAATRNRANSGMMEGAGAVMQSAGPAGERDVDAGRQTIAWSVAADTGLCAPSRVSGFAVAVVRSFVGDEVDA